MIFFLKKNPLSKNKNKNQWPYWEKVLMINHSAMLLLLLLSLSKYFNVHYPTVRTEVFYLSLSFFRITIIIKIIKIKNEYLSVGHFSFTPLVDACRRMRRWSDVWEICYHSALQEFCCLKKKNNEKRFIFFNQKKEVWVSKRRYKGVIYQATLIKAGHFFIKTYPPSPTQFL